MQKSVCHNVDELFSLEIPDEQTLDRRWPSRGAGARSREAEPEQHTRVDELEHCCSGGSDARVSEARDRTEKLTFRANRLQGEDLCA